MSNAWGDSWGTDTPVVYAGPLVCGTGSWTGPKPGDPDNNVGLSANRVYGGIEVVWTYPSTFPHAVAHTLLFRGTSSDFTLAIQRGVVAGSIFFDKMEVTVETQYYYWIQLVSVNGTVGDRIGPVSAYALPLSQQTLESLTGLIDAGVLAQSLKEKISNITVLGQDLVQEVQNRLASNQALMDALAAVQTETGEARTYILNEITERISSDEALVASITALAAGLDGNSAALIEEKLARVTKDEALTQTLSILNANFADNTAAIINEQTARTTADTALANSVTQLLATVGTNTAAISNEVTARATADSAMASNINLLFSESGTNRSAIQTEASTRASADSALSSQITTAQSTLNGNIASVQTSLNTKINTYDGKITAIGALYTAKVDVNGLIGGFGVYNDGKTVEAGFDVDRFWVGRTTNKVKPFVVNNGVVHMDIARIRDADVGTLKIAGNAINVPMSTSGGTGGVYGPYSFTETALASGYQFLNGGSQTTCIVTVMCGNAGGATNARIALRLRLAGGGSVPILDTAISLVGGFTTAAVSTVYTAPFADGWEITENDYLVCEELL